MQKQTKQTNRSRQTRRVSKATTTCTKAKTTSSARRCTLEGSIKAWLSSKETRPKTVFLTLQRTQDGYTVEEATIMNRTNQYGVRPVTVDARAIVTDINRRGLNA